MTPLPTTASEITPNMDIPLRQSVELAAFTAVTHPISRTGILACIYTYVKAKGLLEMPFIRCDEKLKKVLGGAEKVHAFAILSYLEQHLSPISDLSDYILVDAPSAAKPTENTQPATTSTSPTPTREWPHPVLIIKNQDYSPNGALFSAAIPDPLSWFRQITTTVIQSLYAQPEQTPSHISFVRLVIEDMPGVAYCCDADPDPSNPAEKGRGKQIHLSTQHIRNTAGSRAGKGGPNEDLSWLPKLHHEITGVITHESVHAWQHNGNGTCNGGLIEGIADYIRLRANLAPPHWQRARGGNWDDGYSTTGYFLEWIEDTKGVEGFVRSLNLVLEDLDWDEGLFRLLCESGVEDLWDEYQRSFDGPAVGMDVRDPIPTHGV
ncbi:hypothetical protein HK097_006785 [Rhizophlyctis rosea]|uniref:SWIB domain-containing protein n=1 Tax=Rhizophlyctis rosea TaxID=64517 RepID=A0AAD5SJM2_9FUNG|nr:hypothetical protein HK097_006785 [Rhizophlyctis rosea]